MIVPDNLLFSNNHLDYALRRQLASAQAEVDSVSKEQFMANTSEQVAAYVFSKIEIIPLTIYRDYATRSEPRETRLPRRNLLGDMIQSAGVEMELAIPYSGESDLWIMQPSHFTSTSYYGNVEPQRSNDQAGTLRIKLVYTQEEFLSDVVNQEIERNLNSIEQYLCWIKQDIEAHNHQLRKEIERLVSQRRERLGNIQNISKALNIPIQRRDGAPDLAVLPMQRCVIQPLPTRVNQSPEYTISTEDYEYILKVIRHEGRSYERTPATFALHDEEELRDILLAHLNSHYNGLATGETFRKTGKTDICIEFENRAAFVAECKLWKGDKKLLEAVDQLLSYLTWRDCKTALVIFNKDVAGFKQLQDKIADILRQHPNHIRAETIRESGEWRFTFRSKEDEDRFVLVHVFMFNLYVSGK